MRQLVHMLDASEDAIELIKEFEKLELAAYPDPGTGGDPWTIGWGHTGPEVHEGMTISRAQADAWLVEDVAEAEAIVQRAVKVPLAQHEFDALVSFCFNCGPGRVKRGSDPGRDGFVVLRDGRPSTLLRKLNAGDYDAVPDEMKRWNRGGGKVLRGLVRRRAAEAMLWVGGADAASEHAKPDAPAAKPMLSSRTMQGAALSGLGTTGAVITEQAQALQPAAEGFDALKLVCALLLIAGVALTIYGRMRIAREEGV